MKFCSNAVTQKESFDHEVTVLRFCASALVYFNKMNSTDTSSVLAKIDLLNYVIYDIK